MEDERLKIRRAPNFSAEEKAVLIEIIANKYSEIIENKKTDHTTINERLSAWKNIENDFNAVSPISYHRDWEVLKRFYENQKKIVRQLKAKETIAKYKTGGGPEVVIKKDPADDLLLSIINNKSIIGLGNIRDSNQLPQTDHANENNEFVFEIQNKELQKEQNTQIDDSLLTQSSSEPISLETFEDIDMEYGIMTSPNWKRYKASDLKTSINPALKADRTPKRTDKKATPVSLSRRRPTQGITTLTSSHFSEKYNILLDRRLQLVEKQIKQVDDEKAFKDEERCLKLELLRLNIEIKKKELLGP